MTRSPDGSRPADIHLRPLTRAEIPDAQRIDAIAFGESVEAFQTLPAGLPLERSLGAFANEGLVGTSVMLSLELTLPGLSAVPAGGLSWIAVLPTHRRRGILRTMVQRQLADARERGEFLSCLIASESHLYQRFGYGPATFHLEASIDRAQARFRSSVHTPGRMRLLQEEVPLDILSPVWEQVRLTQVGAVSRDPDSWAHWLLEERKEKGQLHILVHESADGDADGFAIYRFLPEWAQGLPRGRIEVIDLASPTPAVRFALWRYLLDLDLVKEVRVQHLAVDDALRWQLAQPRQLRTLILADDLWVRPLDVPRCLAARGYASGGSLRLEVHDGLFPDNDGVYELTAEKGGASCRSLNDGRADLHLGVAALGSVLLGGVSFARLAEAGLVTELTPRVVGRADSMFAVQPAPFSGTHF